VSEFDLLSIAADGMSVQRTLLDVAARNVAAAQASTPQHPYPRFVAHVAARDPDEGFAGVPDDEDDAADAVRSVAAIAPAGEGADALTEMIAVLEAQRAYEANASVFDVGKKLAERTLDVGRP
jgi:flagellar basal body rod protein FlgC